ncbi:MAG: RimK family alpha-L-glutamate ligase [Clostridia bacterium]|nr:RimK family alpha-L-glutamate ligase [Clostridia bacterium]
MSEKRSGILVVNSFLNTTKFGELYSFLEEAAGRMGCTLDVYTSGELFSPVGQQNKLSADFCLFWDKDVPLCLALEKSGMRCYNSSQAILLCDDKALTAQALSEMNIPMPKTLIAPKTYTNIGYCTKDFLDRAEAFLSYPMVIKQRCGSFGAQVYLAQNRADACDILDRCGGNEVILQEFIKTSVGRDLRINIVNGEMQGCMLRYNDDDFRSNITNGGKMRAFVPDADYVNAAIDAARAVGAYFAGVDVMFGKDGPIVCEVNASPHFKSTLEATGVNLADKILESILFTERS